jgi:hypothetical protein
VTERRWPLLLTLIAGVILGAAGVKAAPTPAGVVPEEISAAERWSRIDLDTLSDSNMTWNYQGPQAQWVYASGRWVVHPPLEFAEELIGEGAMELCINRLEAGGGRCQFKISDCINLYIFMTGNVQLDLRAEKCVDRPAQSIMYLNDRDVTTFGPEEIPVTFE